MNTKKVVAIILFVSVLSLFCGCVTEPQDTSGNSKIITDYPLDIVALLEEDFEGFDQLNHQYQNTSYTVQNITGNDITWTIKEGFFSTYACNTSRVSESVIRFESTEKATQNIELSKPFFISYNITEEEMDTIGNSSFLLKGSKLIKDNMTDFYILCFTFYDVFVSIQGYGSTFQEVITYAETIESRMITALTS